MVILASFNCPLVTGEYTNSEFISPSELHEDILLNEGVYINVRYDHIEDIVWALSDPDNPDSESGERWRVLYNGSEWISSLDNNNRKLERTRVNYTGLKSYA